MRGGANLGECIFLNSVDSSSLSEPLAGLAPSWRAEFETPTSAPLIAPVVTITSSPLLYHNSMAIDARHQPYHQYLEALEDLRSNNLSVLSNRGAKQHIQSMWRIYYDHVSNVTAMNESFIHMRHRTSCRLVAFIEVQVPTAFLVTIGSLGSPGSQILMHLCI